MAFVVRCRCGATHLPVDVAVDCVYCSTPTFDHHQVCARCRPLEVLEHHAERVIDVMSGIAPP